MGPSVLPVELWGPWRIEADAETPTLMRIAQAIDSMLRPNAVLDLLANFTAYATDKKKRRIKIEILSRVVDPRLA